MNLVKSRKVFRRSSITWLLLTAKENSDTPRGSNREQDKYLSSYFPMKEIDT
jgi:hypothetical protein